MLKGKGYGRVTARPRAIRATLERQQGERPGELWIDVVKEDSRNTGADEMSKTVMKAARRITGHHIAVRILLFRYNVLQLILFNNVTRTYR